MKTLFVRSLQALCLFMLVSLIWGYQAKDPTPASTGGSTGPDTGGSSTGGTNSPTTGTAMFFTKEDLGVGAISVTVDGKAEGTISHYYPNGITCGKDDVNVTKSVGTYPFKATDGNSC